MASQTELRQQITNQIVNTLRKDLIPWRQPWVNHVNAGLPTNVISQKRYQGVNSILLSMMGMDQGYESKYWATFKQWKMLGGSVKRGETGSQIIFYKPIKWQDMNADGSMKEVTVPYIKKFCVFNSQQTTLDEYKVQNAEDIRSDCSEAYAEAETMIVNSQADIRHGGNQACYYRLQNYIQMPFKKQFTSESTYYETLFHELAHWSGKWLGWDDCYAMNELFADMTACFISTELKIPQNDDFLEQHTSYLASWLTDLESDSKLIFKAASQASKASDFLLAFKDVPIIVHDLDDVPF